MTLISSLIFSSPSSLFAASKTQFFMWAARISRLALFKTAFAAIIWFEMSMQYLSSSIIFKTPSSCPFAVFIRISTFFLSAFIFLTAFLCKIILLKNCNYLISCVCNCLCQNLVGNFLFKCEICGFLV